MENWQINLCVIGSVILILIIAYTCLSMASKSDDISEKDWEEYCKKYGGGEEDE